MTLGKAKLVKRNTDDGCEVFEDDVPLGKIYLVDLDTIQTMRHINREFNIDTDRLCIRSVDPESGAPGGWLIMECLHLEANA